jgi:hypothetical protein
MEFSHAQYLGTHGEWINRLGDSPGRRDNSKAENKHNRQAFHWLPSANILGEGYHHTILHPPNPANLSIGTFTNCRFAKDNLDASKAASYGTTPNKTEGCMS